LSMFIFHYKTYIALFLAGFGASLFATPFVRRLALRLNAVDKPGRRKIHKEPMPLLGGVSIFIPFLALLGCLVFLQNDITKVLFSQPRHILGLLLCGTVAFALGVYDDFRGANAKIKLLVETGIAAMAYALGFRIKLVALPLIGELDLGILSILLTTLWIVGITNAMNLIDGLDGLAAGVAFFVSTANFIISILLNNAFMAVISVILMGCLAGFLKYNFPPASIFLGDTGSLFLGAVLAVSTVLSAHKAPTVVMMVVPVLTLGLPILDTLLAIFRRALAGLPIFTSDQSHIHHALLALGLTHRRAVIVLYVFCIVLVISCILVVSGRNPTVFAALGGAALISAMGVRVLGYTKPETLKTALGKRRNYRRQRRLAQRVIGEMSTTNSCHELWQLLVGVAKVLNYSEVGIAYVVGNLEKKLTAQLSNPRVSCQATHESAGISSAPRFASGALVQTGSGTKGGPSTTSEEQTFTLPKGMGTVKLVRRNSDGLASEIKESALARRVVSTFSRRFVECLPCDASQAGQE
jgi:UDP-GlcNAc:undecaprenyl-phosphate GlcNAc-1-phosphate transferase